MSVQRANREKTTQVMLAKMKTKETIMKVNQTRHMKMKTRQIWQDKFAGEEPGYKTIYYIAVRICIIEIIVINRKKYSLANTEMLDVAGAFKVLPTL